MKKALANLCTLTLTRTVLQRLFKPAAEAKALDVQSLSPAALRDLGLHDGMDGANSSLHARQAWQQYRDYRDWRDIGR